MSSRTRVAVFVVAIAVVGGVLAWTCGALTPFGQFQGAYGALLNHVSVREHHITDVVTAVNFDYRGFDTLGEEFIFLAAVLGVALILRAQPGERAGHVADFATGRAVPPTSDAVRVLGLGLTPLIVLFGLYVVAHGHLTPGGGFQGGVVLATGVLLIYLAGEFDDMHGLYTEVVLERSEAVGGAAFIVVGFVGMFAGGAFLENVLPTGRIGSVFSAGTIPIINASVGLEIAAGLVLILSTFLHQTIVLRRSQQQAESKP